MGNLLNQQLHYCIIGFGVTGRSCLDFLIQHKIAKVTITDVQDNPTIQQQANKYLQQQQFIDTKIYFYFGRLIIPKNVDIIVLSPGIDPKLPMIKSAVQNKIRLTNDINLFLEQIKLDQKNRDIKIAAVTGTNGKTTVVNILAEMAKRSKIKYALCGNVGSPVLDYIFNSDIQLYIIELSSFQLELIDNLNSDVACVLNITPDHLDRHVDFAEYFAVKLKIYKNAKNIVYYRDDPNIVNKLTKQLITKQLNSPISFGVKTPYYPDLGYPNLGGGAYCYDNWIMYGKEQIMPITELPIKGTHNILNILACLAIGKTLQFTNKNMVAAIKNFQGLQHRSQIIGRFSDKVTWINDSKGTNIGATIAAINSIVASSKDYNKIDHNNLIIIMGGVNKNIDFNLLKPVISKHCKAVILLGESKKQLFSIFQESLCCYMAKDLAMAVKMAKQIVTTGDQVLFSPACASFDMFENYQHRGKVFTKNVLDLYNE